MDVKEIHMLGRIAIHLDRDPACMRRLRAAIELAARHKAELVGVYPSGATPQYGIEPIPDEVYQTLRERANSVRDDTRALFDTMAREAGITSHWRIPQGARDEALALHSRYCDVLVMSQAELSDNPASLMPNLPESVIMTCGRPVLMIPAVGEVHPIGRRILFCWDQRRESARAFADAGPLLQSCSELVVLTIDGHPQALRSKDIHPDDFDRYCATRAYPKPRRISMLSDGLGVGNIILNNATDHGSDLIVMGAYGHSRMRQWIMGGASLTLLGSMTVPVLFSH
jgi:nucleotide-binding universal stress UspA family protein